MRKPLSIASVVAFVALGGCDAQEPRDDQIAQQKMIGLSRKAILACMGAPARRRSIGSTEILTYPSADVNTEGGPLNLGVNGLAGPFSKQRFCNVEVILTNAAV